MARVDVNWLRTRREEVTRSLDRHGAVSIPCLARDQAEQLRGYIKVNGPDCHMIVLGRGERDHRTEDKRYEFSAHI